MKKEKDKIKYSYIKVKELFFSLSEREFSLTEVSKLARVSKSNALMAIESLLSEKIINRKIIGRSWVLSFNRTPENFKKKVSYNLNLILENSILAHIIVKYPNAKAIVLFGSYRKGDDTEKSDIDLAIELPGKGKYDIREEQIIKRLGYRENIRLSLHLFNKDKIDKNLLLNIYNGIVLEGFLEI